MKTGSRLALPGGLCVRVTVIVTPRGVAVRAQAVVDGVPPTREPAPRAPYF